MESNIRAIPEFIVYIYTTLINRIIVDYSNLIFSIGGCLYKGSYLN